MPAAKRDDAVRLLVVAVTIDVAIALVLRTKSTLDFVHDQSSWVAWLGTFSAVYLLFVVYALAQVVREMAQVRGRLTASDQALEAHVEASGEWHWQATPDLVLTYSSRQLTELLGYTPSEVCGRSACELMTAETRAAVQRNREKGLLEQGWRDRETDWVHADGHVVTLRHSGLPIRGETGALVGFRGSGGLAPPDRQLARRLLGPRRQVEDVLAGSAVHMVFQPIIHIGSGRLAGVEALARFADRRPPDVWFEQAGQVGLRVELELLAVRHALAVLPQLPATATMSVNACPEAVNDERFGQALRSSGAPLDRLVIEVTEHVRIDDYDAIRAVLDALRADGARLAVDDTGAGFSSMTHVIRLRPDIIKLDRSLVNGVGEDPARKTLVTAMTLLAIDLGATVTAEGVETVGELETVAALGVDHAQGYLIGMPAELDPTWARQDFLAEHGVELPAR